MPMEQLSEMRRRILLAALPNMVFDGWSPKAVQAGLRAEGLEPDKFETEFPGDMAELARFFSTFGDQVMTEEMAKLDLEELSFEERAGRAIRLRLEALAPHREAVRRLFAYLALRANAPLAAHNLTRTADAICRAAGDQSTDFTYYTRRTMVAAFQTGTVLYWLADETENMIDTVDFIQRRVSRLVGPGRMGPEIGHRLGLLPSPFRLFRLLSARTR
ncbi:MAG: COQ9 family protein [Rhodospirillales bacterium]|nr:COQ9 family protein [Rhodospirillales bacterium]